MKQAITKWTENLNRISDFYSFLGIEFGTGTYAAAALPPIVPPEQSQFVCEDCKIDLNDQAAYTEHRGILWELANFFTPF